MTKSHLNNTTRENYTTEGIVEYMEDFEPVNSCKRDEAVIQNGWSPIFLKRNAFKVHTAMTKLGTTVLADTNNENLPDAQEV